MERVTAREAATLLGVHYNTVRNRINAGMYRAEKVHTENGPTWMIERDSLTDNAPTSARQQGVVGVGALQQEAIQELARAIVRETKQDTWVEAEKLQHETAKTQALITTALLGASGAARFLPDPQHTFVLGAAFVFGLASLGFTLNHMYFIATGLGSPPSSRTARMSARLADLLSTLLLLLATSLLATYVTLNL
jgi:hypothetical protein